MTREAGLFNKNAGYCEPETVCIVAESFPLAVRQTWFQPGKAPLKGGGNYNPLKVAKYLAD